MDAGLQSQLGSCSSGPEGLTMLGIDAEWQRIAAAGEGGEGVDDANPGPEGSAEAEWPQQENDHHH